MRHIVSLIAVSALLILTFNLSVHAGSIMKIQSGTGKWISNGETFSYPVIPLHSLVTRGFTVYNQGDSNLTIGNPKALIESNTGGFIQASAVVLSDTISPGSESKFRIAFEATTTGLHTATIRLNTNDPNGNPFRFTVTCYVPPDPKPDIHIELLGGTVLQNKGKPYWFTAVNVNTVTARTFKVFNVGTATLSISNPTNVLSGSASFSQIPSVVLAPQIQPESDSVQNWSSFAVQFQSATSGTFSTTIKIFSNDADENPFEVELFITVNPTTAPSIRITNPVSSGIPKGSIYTMPETVCNNPVNGDFTIHNDGNAVLNVSSVSIQGQNFTLSGFLSGSIAAGDQKKFTVTFVSCVIGLVQSAITINSNDADDASFIFSVKVNVNNQGHPSIRVVSEEGSVISHNSTYNFPDTTSGVEVQRNFTVYNDGNANLDITNPTNLFFGEGFQQASNVVLSSQIIPGGSSKFRIKLNQNQAKLYSGTVTINCDDPSFPAFQFQIQGLVTSPPRIDSIEPNQIQAGIVSTLTIRGVRFTNAIVSIGTKKVDPQQPDRAFPTAQIQSISADGKTMQVSVNATNPDVSGHYALYVKNELGADGTAFRVVGNAPEVDLYTPSEVHLGGLYVVDLIGVNLQGANVFSPNGDIQFIDLDNTNDSHIHGLMQVNGSNPGGIEIIVEKPSGLREVLPMALRANSASVVTQTQTINAGSPNAPEIHIQQFTLHAEGGMQNVTAQYSDTDCLDFHGSRMLIDSIWSTTLVQNPLNGKWGKFGDLILNNLLPSGLKVPLRTMTFVRWAFLEGSFQASICLGGDSDVVYCLFGDIGGEIPGVVGWRLYFELCFEMIGGPLPPVVKTQGTGLLRNFRFHRLNSQDDLQCVDIVDKNPTSTSGIRDFEVSLKDCCAEEVAIDGDISYLFGDFPAFNHRIGTATPQETACVGKTFNFSTGLFIPSNYVDVAYCDPSAFCGAFNQWHKIVKTDDRGFQNNSDQYRVRQDFTVIFRDNNQLPLVLLGKGILNPTSIYSSDALSDDGLIHASEYDAIPNDCHLWIEDSFPKFPNGPLSISIVEQNPSSIKIRAKASASSSFNFLVPAVDYDFFLTVNQSGQYELTGQHDCVPSYDVIANGKDIYRYQNSNCTPAGCSCSEFVFCLPGDGDIDVFKSGIIKNTSPSAANDSFTLSASTSKTIDVRTNDSDPEGNVLAIESTSQPSYGSVAVNFNNTITYNAPASFTGVDTFNYTVTDGEFDSTATVSVTVTNPTLEDLIGNGAYWKLDEVGTPVAVDASGNGNTGSFMNGAHYINAKRGYGINLDGVDDRVSVAANTLNQINNNFTISFWAQPRSTHEIDAESTSGIGGTSGQRFVLEPANLGQGAAGVGVSVGTNGVSVYEHSPGHAPSLLSYVAPISRWTHITVVYADKKPKLYVNGYLVRIGLTSPITQVRPVPTAIGGYSWGHFDGFIDDVRIFNRSLSDADVVRVAGLASHWKLDEGTGNISDDVSGNKNKGTLNNGVRWTSGKIGTALDFDGIDDYVKVDPGNTSLANINNSFVISFWAYPRSTHEIDPESVTGIAGVSGQRYAFEPLWLGGNDAGVGVSVGTNGISVYEHGPSYMPAVLVYPTQINEWTHIAVVYFQKQPHLYVNGTLLRSGAFSPRNKLVPIPNTFGGPYYVSGHYDGLIDDVRIYDNVNMAGVPAMMGLAAQWKCDEKTGDILWDHSGNSNHGQLKPVDMWSSGKMAGGVNFDGVDDHVLLSSYARMENLKQISNTFTIAFWANARSTHEIDVESTTGYSGTTGQRYAFEPLWRGGNDAGAGVSVGWNGVSVYEHAGGYMPPLLVHQTYMPGWNHIAVVYINKQPRLYINGQLVRVGLTSTRTNVVPMASALGAVSYGKFDGLLDDARIYSYALSPSDLQRIMGETHWKLDEASGVVTRDSSGNQNIGTLQNGVKWVSGKHGSGLQFDGVDDYVSFADATMSAIQNNFTVSFWVNPLSEHEIDTATSGQVAGLSGQRFALDPSYMNPPDAGVGVSVGTNGITIYEHSASYLPARLTYQGPITGWTHVTIVYKDKQPWLYVNGGLINYGTASSINIHPLFNLGGQSWGKFHGYLDDIRIFNRVLSSAEIQQLLTQ